MLCTYGMMNREVNKIQDRPTFPRSTLKIGSNFDNKRKQTQELYNLEDTVSQMNKLTTALQG